LVDAAWLRRKMTEPDRQDFEAVNKAVDWPAGFKYSVALAHKLIRLYERGRLSRQMMRDIDQLHMHYEVEEPGELVALIRETNKLDAEGYRLEQALRLHALYQRRKLGSELMRAMEGR
jgi:hypothetical protein